MVETSKRKSKIQKIYDLKGSWNNRLVHLGENQTMKDRNLLSCKNARERENKPGLLQFDYKEDIKYIKQIIKSDARFLQKLGLLDYSLLLAVEKFKNKEE